MPALIWIGLALLALGVLAWFVLKVALYFAVTLFIVGIALLIWGAMRAKQAVD